MLEIGLGRVEFARVLLQRVPSVVIEGYVDVAVGALVELIEHSTHDVRTRRVRANVGEIVQAGGRKVLRLVNLV